MSGRLAWSSPPPPFAQIVGRKPLVMCEECGERPFGFVLWERLLCTGCTIRTMTEVMTERAARFARMRVARTEYHRRQKARKRRARR